MFVIWSFCAIFYSSCRYDGNMCIILVNLGHWKETHFPFYSWLEKVKEAPGVLNDATISSTCESADLYLRPMFYWLNQEDDHDENK